MISFLLYMALMSVDLVSTSQVPERTQSYVLYTPRNDGFNNQVQTMIGMIKICSQMNWTMVLPEFWDGISWNSPVSLRRNTSSFDTHFDVASLSKIISIIDLTTFHYICDGIVNHIYSGRYDPVCSSMYLKKVGMQCSPTGNYFSNIRDVTGLCVGVTGHSAFWDFGGIRLPEIGKIKSGKAEVPESLRNVFLSLTHSSEVSNLRREFLAKREKYGCIHIRRGDYLKSKYHKKTSHKTLTHMVSFLKMQGLRHIFVATNDVKWVRKAVGKSVSFTPKKFVKTLDAQLLSTVEQDICEHAEIFIGSCQSSWSQFVHFRRYFIGKQEVFLCDSDYERQEMGSYLKQSFASIFGGYDWSLLRDIRVLYTKVVSYFFLNFF